MIHFLQAPLAADAPVTDAGGATPAAGFASLLDAATDTVPTTTGATPTAVSVEMPDASAAGGSATVVLPATADRPMPSDATVPTGPSADPTTVGSVESSAPAVTITAAVVANGLLAPTGELPAPLLAPSNAPALPAAAAAALAEIDDTDDAALLEEPDLDDELAIQGLDEDGLDGVDDLEALDDPDGLEDVDVVEDGEQIAVELTGAAEVHVDDDGDADVADEDGRGRAWGVDGDRHPHWPGAERIANAARRHGLEVAEAVRDIRPGQDLTMPPAFLHGEDTAGSGVSVASAVATTAGDPAVALDAESGSAPLPVIEGDLPAPATMAADVPVETADPVLGGRPAEQAPNVVAPADSPSARTVDGPSVAPMQPTDGQGVADVAASAQAAVPQDAPSATTGTPSVTEAAASAPAVPAPAPTGPSAAEGAGPAEALAPAADGQPDAGQLADGQFDQPRDGARDADLAVAAPAPAVDAPAPASDAAADTVVPVAPSVAPTADVDAPVDTPRTIIQDLQQVARVTPTSSGGDRASEVATGNLTRVLEAVEQLRNAPPPRTMGIELAEEGVRLQISLRGRDVVITVHGDEGVRAMSRDLESALDQRGFRFAGFRSGSTDRDAAGRGSQRQPSPQDRPDPRGRDEQPTRRPPTRRDDALRI